MTTGIIQKTDLPNDAFAGAWEHIKADPGLKPRLVAQALMSLSVRQRLPFEAAPLHGLILLEGPPGTGKTTLARGLANELAKYLPKGKTRFVQVDPHALASSSLGRSQQAVTKLFESTLPEVAHGGIAIVLLDELETLAAARAKLSMDANPIDVHRATDAVLSGMDLLTREHNNVLLVATTNFIQALDTAVVSRADFVAHVGLPNQEAREEIVTDMLAGLAKVWPKVGQLEKHVSELARAADGLDGRRIRKTVLAAAAEDIKVASDLNLLTKAHILAAITAAKQVKHES